MKFDLKKLLEEAEEVSRYWQARPDTLLSQDEIEQRLQQAKSKRDQRNDD